ncbi:hypothetical protein FI667_g153, partial [Globisporangium splendens]
MDPQKPVDPAQVKFEDGGKRAGRSPLSCLEHWLMKLLLVLFVLGNITALYVLHFVNRPSPTTRFTFTNFAATGDSSPKKGDPVSLSSTATLCNSASTTAYLNKLTLTDGDAYDYINFAPMGTSQSSYATNIMSCRRTVGTAQENVLTTITVDTVKQVTTGAISTDNIVTGLNIRGLATLSDSLMVVLAADGSNSPYPSYIIPATITGSSVQMMQANKVALTTGSLSNSISPLTSSAFVAAYFDPCDSTSYMQRVKVGVVDSTSHTITYSADVSFGPANTPPTSVYTNFGKPATVASSTDPIIIIPYFATTGGLCVTKATYTIASNIVSAFSTGVCQAKLTPAFLIDSIMLSDSVMAIALYDKSNNNVLTVMTAVISGFDGSLSFRSTFALTDVGGSFEWDNYYGYSPKPSLAKLRGNRMAVSFLNPTLAGRMSVKILKYSLETLAFKDATPVLPFAAKDFTLVIADATHSKQAITLDIIATSNDSVIAGYMGNRDNVAHQRFSVVEHFGEPFAISGNAKMSSSKLVAGQVYYATTTGALLQSNGTNVGGEYTYSADGTCLMTADSKIGFTVDSDELFVNTAL